MRYLIILCGLLANFGAFASAGIADSSAPKLKFLEAAPSVHKPRVWILTGSAAAAYSATVVGLDRAWYAAYPRSRFHFFNDWNGWRQQDKFGHAFTAYFESQWIGHFYQWAGLPKRRAAVVGASAGMLFQTSLELLDAFSAGWGFSVGDMAFNTLGSGLYLGQELLWKEQRIRLKMSSHRPNYSKEPIQAINSQEVTTADARAKELFGTSFPELLFKEYNGQTLWVSANISAFLREDTRLPAWINVAAGYSIENVLGAERNSWTNANGSIFVAPARPRMSQYFLSLDIDFERIPTKKRWLRTIFKALNIFKIPFPALELNSMGQLKLHPFYF